jgi:hypothetical protein
MIDKSLHQNDTSTHAGREQSHVSAVSKRGRRAVLSLGYQDRLERLWLASERAGEYATLNGDIHSRLDDVRSGGAA